VEELLRILKKDRGEKVDFLACVKWSPTNVP
jgi:hypothetical protein